MLAFAGGDRLGGSGAGAGSGVADAETLLEDYGTYVNPGLARLFRFMGLTGVEWEGEGALVRDAAGNTYIDCGSGYAVLNLGHRHPRVVAAVREQLDRLPVSTRVLVNAPQVELAELLARVTPGRLRCSFLCHSGTEAVEAALKLARLRTGRTRVVAAAGGFHGKTMGSLAATGNPHYRRGLEPLLGGVDHVPYGDLEAMAAALTPDTAAVILEPIQGEAGVVVPPPGYLKGVERLCRERGVLLVLDEVQTGMGRTGRLFACQHEEVEPDLLTLAKALGGGVLPVGACVGTPEIFSLFDEEPLLHTVTMGGNPLACAAARAAIQVCLEEDLPGQAARKGERALTVLGELRRRHPEVLTDVRGRGLLIGLEAATPGVGGALLAELIERRVLLVPSLNNFAILRFAPPLVIPDDLLEEALARVEAAVARVAEVARDL